MYLVWKRRQSKGVPACELCGAAGKHARSTLVPLIVSSRPVSPAQQQAIVARLACLRNCCLHNEAGLQAWWKSVDAEMLALTEAEAARIRRLLADGLARAKREGSCKSRQRSRA